MKLHVSTTAAFALALPQISIRRRAKGAEVTVRAWGIAIWSACRLPATRHLFAILLLCAAFLWPGPVCSAQDRGTITGTVTDPNGAPVPNAKITARNTATSLTHEATASEDGTYSIVYLPVGSYTVGPRARFH